MGKIINLKNPIISFIFLALLVFQFQNCGEKSPVNFFGQRQSLTSSATGGGTFDGKPEHGNYCRAFDDIQCQAQVKDIQGLVNVDNSGIHLTVDNCASTSFDFLSTDAAVTFTSLLPEYLGVSRGIFKKCEVGSGNIPLPPVDMTDAYCTSKDGNTAVVINKNTQNKIFDFKMVFRNNGSLLSASGSAITKTLNSGMSSYTSQTEAFSLTISQGNSQTMPGQLEAVVDQKIWNTTLNCRQASPQPTVIVEKDMELSSTWINTSQLVGYWKLNETGAAQDTAIMDASSFLTSGILETANDGQIKSDPSIPGGALGFDGIDDHIRISRPLDGHLDFGLRSFSYMVWVKKTGNAGLWDMPIFHGGSQNAQAGFDIECGSSNAGCYANISDGLGLTSSMAAARLTNSSASLIGRWVLLTAVVDRSNNQFRAYLDGVLVGTGNISNVGSVDSNLILQIGAGSDSGGMSFPFLGFIDDVAIWNRTLSDAEILEIFQRLRPKFN